MVSLLRLVPEDDGAGFQGFGQVDEALVVGAAEAQTKIFAGGDERPVDEDVESCEQRVGHAGQLRQILAVDVAGERPDGFFRVGGAVANNFLMQFQSDILGTRVERPEVREVTALGAAYLAGLAVGFWQNLDELQEKAVIEREFRPGIETTERNYRYSGWKKAVKRALAWEEHDEA